jgi:penicillin V acylase-like amidase (Ntn superfamily)
MLILRKNRLLVYVIMVLLGGLSLASAQDSSPLTFPTGSRACTSFCLNNNGHTVFGSNFDNNDYDGLLFVNKRNLSKMGFETSLNNEKARWTSQYGSVTFNLVGYNFPWAGMNEAGLVISTMQLGETGNPVPDDRPPLLSPLWMQYILDTCATVDEVLATDDDVRITGNIDHFLVCDQTATCAVIEFVGGERIVYTGAELPISVLVNSTYASALEVWQAWQADPDKNADALSASAPDRFILAANQVQNFTAQDTAGAVDYAFETLTMVSSPEERRRTRWSIVFDAENRTVHFRTWNHSTIRSLYFDELDFSCQTPVRMTNIKAELEGNIAADLIDYDHDLSLAHFVSFLKELGDSTPESEVDAMLQMAENFPCGEE